MARSGITVKIEGFEELFNQIEKAGGSMNKAADSCIRKSAQIMQEELKTQMYNANVPDDLINDMPPPKIEVEGNLYSASVGYEKGIYNPKDLTDSYKVIFLNYGTPKRKEHGKVKDRGFIRKAKNKARPQIKKEQQKTLEKILGRLKLK